MRRLLPILVLLLASPCFGAVAHVVDNQGFCNVGAGSGNMTSCAAPATVKTFTFTATNTNDAVLVAVGCGATLATPSAVSLSASGWTFTQVGSIIGSTTLGFQALFKAYSPNTSAATITQTWTVSSGGCGNNTTSFMNDLMGEFSGEDLTNFIDASNGTTGASGCNSAGTVTPVASNDGIWFACNDTVSGTVYTNSYTKGGDDTQGDVSSWKILSGGAGVAQTPGYPTTTGNTTIWSVAIKPSGGAAAPSGFNKRQKIEQLEGIR